MIYVFLNLYVPDMDQTFVGTERFLVKGLLQNAHLASARDLDLPSPKFSWICDFFFSFFSPLLPPFSLLYKCKVILLNIRKAD